MGHHQIVQKRCVLFPDFVFFIDNPLFHSVVERFLKRKQHINQAIKLARPQRNKHYTRTIFFRRSRHDKNWKLFPLVVNSSWQSERARWRAYSAPNSNITWPQRPNDISFLMSAAVNESKLTEDSIGSWKAPNVGQRGILVYNICLISISNSYK